MTAQPWRKTKDTNEIAILCAAVILRKLVTEKLTNLTFYAAYFFALVMIGSNDR